MSSLSVVWYLMYIAHNTPDSGLTISVNVSFYHRKTEAVELTKKQMPPVPHWPLWSPGCSRGLWSRIQDEAIAPGLPSKPRTGNLCSFVYFV